MKKRKTVCLNMIVKNEKHIIERCLNSVKNYIDYWVISDTGSTDGTQDFIKQYFKEAGIPGELHEHQWENFAHNRNLALEHTAGKSDYIFFMDADDYLENPKGLEFTNLTDDSYMLRMRAGTASYSCIKLVKSELPWIWRSILHEVLNCDIGFSVEQYHDDSLIIHSTREGARGSDPEKYKKDAQILEKALIEDPENSRYQFYLGRSYYAYQNYEKALPAYEKRSIMGDWEEEVYFSLLSIGYCKKNLSFNKLDTLNAFMKAFQYRSTRLEGLYEAIKICREEGIYHLGYQLGNSIGKSKIPDDSLFLDESVYKWKILDEYSICAIETGNLSLARGIIAHLLSNNMAPDPEHERLKSNLDFAIRF